MELAKHTRETRERPISRASVYSWRGSMRPNAERTNQIKGEKCILKVVGEIRETWISDNLHDGHFSCHCQ